MLSGASDDWGGLARGWGQGPPLLEGEVDAPPVGRITPAFLLASLLSFSVAVPAPPTRALQYHFSAH